MGEYTHTACVYVYVCMSILFRSIFPGSQLWGYKQAHNKGNPRGIGLSVNLPLSSCPRCSSPEVFAGLRRTGGKIKRRQGLSPLPVSGTYLLLQPVSGHMKSPPPHGGNICQSIHVDSNLHPQNAPLPP